MRNFTTFIKDISKKPPLVFPLVALFHIFALIYIAWSVSDIAFPMIEWLSPLWMLVYTIAWIALCDLRRWGAFVYVGATIVSLALTYLMNKSALMNLYTSPLFPLDVIFCFFVLFYYKRFE